MDSVITAILVILVLSIFILATFLHFRYFSAKKKGERGEALISSLLGDTVAGEKYIINDLLITTETGSTCQIDHIVINKFGIWVIETKNYSGIIYGNENRQEWTQVLAYGNVKNRFYNPIKQNKTHIYHLSKLLKPNIKIYNIVVFINADISNVSANGVCNENEIENVIDSGSETVLTAADMDAYYNKLLTYKSDPLLAKDHVKNIEILKNNLKDGICPRCGAQLVVHKGKNGEFWGCSNYPNCKFTKNL